MGQYHHNTTVKVVNIDLNKYDNWLFKNNVDTHLSFDSVITPCSC